MTHTNLSNRSKNKTQSSSASLSLDAENVRKKKLAAFQKAAGLKFKNLDLLNLAFVHRSATNEVGVLQGKFSHSKVGGTVSRANNERLEFLGDAILGAVCASLLFNVYPDKTEGELAKIKAVVVSEDILSGLAKTLHIDEMLLLGKGEDLSGGRSKKTILADAMEALIGAVYIDSGYKPAFDFVSCCIIPEIKRVTGENYHKDYKSLLQEYCQRFFRSYPEYVIIKKTGPEHERTFQIEVRINGTSYGQGTGRNKKTAEQEAAKAAWEQINNN